MTIRNKIIVNVTHQNTIDYALEQFERDVQKIVEIGGTHVMINQIEKSRWIWEEDRNDPYPNWGMLMLSLFKLVVPEALKPYLPEDYAARNYEVLKARMDIASKYGLKGALSFCEPFYLPESAYRDHPHWRGPRCEHPRRARQAYYSPCIDNTEVLDMYRQAMGALVRDMDIDYIFIHTNDSGGGICWSDGLYAGKNGPTACRHRSMADRVLGFMEALTEGAQSAGRHVEIDLSSVIGVKAADHELNAVGPSLKDNMSINRITNKGYPLTHFLDVDYEYTLAPIRNVPVMLTFAEKLEAALQSPSPNLYYILVTTDHDEYFKLIKAFNNQPTDGIAERIGLLKQVAAQIVGDAHANKLLEAWSEFQKATYHYFDTRIEGLSWVSTNQRWINRPFVLFPAELSEEEKAYYRPYQFQANDEAQADDLLNMQCTSFIRGSYAVGMAVKSMEKAMARVSRAESILRSIGEQLQDDAQRANLQLMADRMDLLNRFFLNAIHAMKFQDIIDRTDYEQEPEISPRWPIDADPRFLEFEAITRAEIDNTLRIIELIQERESEMLVMAPSEALEDIFLFSPNLVAQLHRKINIMLDHQMDAKRLFVTPNK